MKKYTSGLILILFTAVNVFFNYNLFWKQLVSDDSKTGAIWGEVRVFEWMTSKFYRTIVAFKNPFGQVDGMLYPFQIHLGLTDAANGFFYIPFQLLRLSFYQSFVMVIAIGQIFANVGMYLLLRKLKFTVAVSVIISLAFTYMTFLAPRQGHINYWVTYIFPWTYLSLLHVISQRSKSKRYIAAAGVSFFMTLALWLNFYYFIMLCISLAIFGVYFLITDRQKVIEMLLRRWKEILIAFSVGLTLLFPWGVALYSAYKFDVFPKVSGWGGAIHYSSDLFSYFVPSQYNHYIYHYFTSAYDAIFTRIAPFAHGAFENFSYPGIIILVAILSLVILFTKRSFASTRRRALPFIIVTGIFLILTLGPFLHVYGKWGLTLEEGIRIVIPLPYVLLHYIPFIENIRVPGRLIVAFIFFAYIVSAYVLSYLLSKSTKNQASFILVGLFFIFLIDNRYVSDLKPPKVDYPYKIFAAIKEDPENVSVLELPFVVRDGFTYLGDADAVLGIVGESHFDKPILGGYTGRIADYKKAYYFHSPLFGYLGRSIDTNINQNPSIDKEELPYWENIQDIPALDALDFLSAKYVIVDTSKEYVATASSELQRLGFQEVMKEKSFSLLAREPNYKEFLYVDVGDQNAVTYLGMGWKGVLSGGRPTSRKASVMFKVLNERPMQFVMEGGVYKESSASIYVNKRFIAKTKILPGENRYIVNTKTYLKTGINTVYIIFDSGEGDEDVAFFRKLYLRDPE